MNAKLQLLRAALFSCLFGLLMVFAWQLQQWLANGDTLQGGLVLFVLKLLPVLIVLPGLLKGTWRSHIWLCFISLFYFLVACLMAFGSEFSGQGYLLLFFSVTIFISAMMFARLSQQIGNQENS